jgi:ribosome-associated toxin RatA of RatAB toxin-antitoxin module
VRDAQILQRLNNGEVIVDVLPAQQGGGAARVQAVFDLSAVELWALLGSCRANREFVKGLRICAVTDETATTAITRQAIKGHWYTPTLEYRFRTLRQPHDWIRIELLDGDLEQLQGSWLFEAQAPSGLLLVTHSIAIQPRMPAPGWLVARTLRKDLPRMLTCLRWVARASLDEAQSKVDRSACDSSASQVGHDGPD